MKGKIIDFARTTKGKVAVGVAAGVAVVSNASAALAVGTANADVTTAFTSLKDDVIATLGVVAGLAVGVMAIFLAWKYGRKIFNQVAK